MADTTDRNGIEVEPQQVAGWLRQDAAPEVVDVREPHEREAGHIAGTAHIPFAELSGAADLLARDRPIVFYCRSGARSMVAAQAFRKAGLDVYTMKGGLLRWVAEGLPISPEDGVVANH